MKPRLDPAHRTPEDRFIWLRLIHGRPTPICIRAYMQADRRDADLMLRAMQWRWIPGIGIRPESFAMWSSDPPLQLIDAGGDLSADWYHDIT